MASTSKVETAVARPAVVAEGKRLSGAQVICESLRREGVEVIFGVPGGAVLPLYDVLLDYPFRHVLVRQEQAAAMAADGYARATGRVGVCMATSGPGATNLVTGIANAQMDSVPIVAITGQVPTTLIGGDAFQETDVTGITLPITKHNFLVERVEELARTVKTAFYLAATGRPGPVLIDVPRDVLTSETTFEYPEAVELRGYKPTLFGNARQIKQAAELIAHSHRPLIIAGHGVIISRAYAELRELVEKADIPVATTLLGISCFPESHPLSLGMVGMHGTSCANRAVCHCDLLIAIGMRMDDRVTGKISGFAPNARVIHIDIDPAEIGKNVRVHVPIVGDVKNVLRALNLEVAPAEHGAWRELLAGFEAAHPSCKIPDTGGLTPQFIMCQLWEVTGGDAIITTGVGQHQMWAARYFTYDHPNTLITAGGLGAMGYELPSAMGAKLGCPEKTVWSIAGDGGFQMNIQELATIAQENIALKVALIDNGYLGMVRQWQQLFYQRRYSASALGHPDFVKIAEGYGIAAWRVTTKDEVEPALRRAMAHPGPVIVDFMVEPEENVYPMIPPGGSLFDMMEDPRD